MSSRCLGYVRLRLADAPFIGFIPVRDLAAARAFYEGTLGLRVVADTSFALVLEAAPCCGSPPSPGSPHAPSPPPGGTCPTSAPPSVNWTAGASSSPATTAWRKRPRHLDHAGDRVASFQDPDGNTLSLTTFAAR